MGNRITLLIVAGLVLALFVPVQAQVVDEATAPKSDGTKLYSGDEHAEAIAAAKRALAMRQKALGPDHLAVGGSLEFLAVLYYRQGRYATAVSLCRRALEVYEKALGPENPSIANALNNLAQQYRAEGRYADAETLYQRSLAIREKGLGPDHPSLAPRARQPGRALQGSRPLR